MNRSVATLMLSLAVFSMYGCNPLQRKDSSDYRDGSAGQVTAEVYSMEADVLALISSSELAKSASPQTEEINIDVVVIPWHYDETVNGWVRETTADLKHGERNRLDTVWFYDAGGALLNEPTSSTIYSFRHVRSVTFTGQNNWNHHFEITTYVDRSSDGVVFVRNGEMRGAYNGETHRSVSIQNVRTEYDDFGSGPRWPSAGKILLERVLWTADITFNGSLNATVNVTRKRSGETRTYNINIETANETD